MKNDLLTICQNIYSADASSGEFNPSALKGMQQAAGEMMAVLKLCQPFCPKTIQWEISSKEDNLKRFSDPSDIFVKGQLRLLWMLETQLAG